MRRNEAIGFLSSHRQELAERFGVSSLALFGSVARDEAGPDSDVDILVGFRETPGQRGGADRDRFRCACAPTH
jgi:predicted nucleotidyltransferase